MPRDRLIFCRDFFRRQGDKDGVMPATYGSAPPVQRTVVGATENASASVVGRPTVFCRGFFP